MRQVEIEWIKNSSYGFPLWIALTSDPDSIIYLRHRFIFISAKNFTKLHIQRALPGLAKEFDVPDEMMITAYSNKEMIRRGVSSLGRCIRFPHTPEGMEAERRYGEKYLPLKSGYHRAYYYRSRNGEVTFRYSPDPDKEEMLLIDLSSDSAK